LGKWRELLDKLNEKSLSSIEAWLFQLSAHAKHLGVICSDLIPQPFLLMSKIKSFTDNMAVLPHLDAQASLTIQYNTKKHTFMYFFLASWEN
jgi:3-methyladenine DNA glycosylase AlkC